jgi:hypothetical protein
MGGKLCASLPITHHCSIPHLFILPAHSPPFSPFVIHPSFFWCLKPLEIRYKLHLSLYLFQCFMPLEIRQKLHLSHYPFNSLHVFRFITTQRLYTIFSSAPHRVLCNFWKGFMIKIFKSRSTLLLRFLHDMLLTNGFSGVPGFHRWSPVPPPPPASRRVACTLQSVPRSGRRVTTPFDPTASHHFGHRWFRAKPVFPVAERPPLGGACSSRAVTDGSHCSSSCQTAADTVYVFISLLFFWAHLLYPSPPVYPCFCVWVLVTQYTCDIIFNGDPGFVASVPRAKGPASSEALPPRTFILSLNLGCPSSPVFCSFKFSL